MDGSQAQSQALAAVPTPENGSYSQPSTKAFVMGCDAQSGNDKVTITVAIQGKGPFHL